MQLSCVFCSRSLSGGCEEYEEMDDTVADTCAFWVEVVLLLDVDVERGGGSPSSEDGVSQLTTTLVFLMLNSSGGRPPSSISVSEKKSPQLGPPISKATCASRTWLQGQPRSLPDLARATSPLPMALLSRTLTIVQKRGNSASLE